VVIYIKKVEQQHVRCSWISRRS